MGLHLMKRGGYNGCECILNLKLSVEIIFKYLRYFYVLIHYFFFFFFFFKTLLLYIFFFFFSSRRRHTRSTRDRSSDVCSSDLIAPGEIVTLFGNAIGPATLTQFSDRKSTRLNSSHEWISYAVFCLKKKKED